MHIAYLCADRGIPIDGTKGASIHVRAVAQALQGRGHRVHILAAGAAQRPKDFLPEVSSLGLHRRLKRVRVAIDEAQGDRVLGREVHGLMQNAGALQLLEALHSERPIDAIYERYSLWSWAGMQFAAEHGVPWVVEMNAPLVEEQRTYRGLHFEPVATALEAQVLRRADAVVVPAGELRSYIEQRVGPGPRVVVIPNGVDLKLFQRPPVLRAEERSRLEGRFVVAFSGSLKPWHGIEVLLLAFERLIERVPAAHLLIIGDGPLRGDVEDAARRLGEGRVTATGAVPHEKVPSWLAHAHVGVAPYPRLPRFYFSPLKVVEYLAAGLPTVASAIGQLLELVEPEKTGLLVPPGEPEPLTAALERLHDEPDLRRRMGRRGAGRASRSHGWERVGERIEGLLTPRGSAEPECAARPALDRLAGVR